MNDLNVAGGVMALIAICTPLLIYSIYLKRRSDHLASLIEAEGAKALPPELKRPDRPAAGPAAD